MVVVTIIIDVTFCVLDICSWLVVTTNSQDDIPWSYCSFEDMYFLPSNVSILLVF